jgi:hypothetical protein
MIGGIGIPAAQPQNSLIYSYLRSKDLLPQNQEFTSRDPLESVQIRFADQKNSFRYGISFAVGKRQNNNNKYILHC